MVEPWSSVEKIASHLGVARETVYRWINDKGLPAHRIGKFWKFKISEVDEWIRAGGASDGPNDSPKGNSNGSEREARKAQGGKV